MTGIVKSALRQSGKQRGAGLANVSFLGKSTSAASLVSTLSEDDSKSVAPHLAGSMRTISSLLSGLQS